MLSDEDLCSIIDGLDGQAHPDLASQLQASHEAQERLRDLEQARQVLASSQVSPLDDQTVDILIGKALDAGASSKGSGSVARFAPPSTIGRQRRSSTLLVAAAVVIMAGIGLTLIWGGTRNSASDSATKPTPLDLSLPEPPKLAVSPVALADLGTFKTIQDLRSSLKDGIPGRPKGTTVKDAPTDTEIAWCRDQVAKIFLSEKLNKDSASTGLAKVGSRQFLVFAFTYQVKPKDASQLMVAADVTSCTPTLTWQR